MPDVWLRLDIDFLFFRTSGKKNKAKQNISCFWDFHEAATEIDWTYLLNMYIYTKVSYIPLVYSVDKIICISEALILCTTETWRISPVLFSF